jgi:uncharacterized cupin superfamily protein
MFSAVRRHPNVVHIDHVPSDEEAHGRFAFTRRKLWLEAAGRQLACSWYEVPPGKQAVPHHFHSAFEEAIFVLEGKGAARIGDERLPIAAGDYIAYPAGPATAHSIINTSDAPLRYLRLSTLHTMDIVVYPDSNKISFAAGLDPTRAQSEQSPWVMKIVKDQPSVDYYEDEDS